MTKRKPVHYREQAGRPVSPEPVREPALVAAEAPRTVTFARDILPIFAPFASTMMWRFDLTDYSAVMANAKTIDDRISDHENPMPPPPFPMLTKAEIETFKTWIKDGCQP